MTDMYQSPTPNQLLPTWAIRPVALAAGVVLLLSGCSQERESYTGPAVAVQEGTPVYDGPKDEQSCGEVAVAATVQPTEALVSRRHGSGVGREGDVDKIGVPKVGLTLKPDGTCKAEVLWLPGSWFPDLPKQPYVEPSK